MKGAEDTRAERILREIPALSEPELIAVLHAAATETEARLMRHAGEREDPAETA